MLQSTVMYNYLTNQYNTILRTVNLPNITLVSWVISLVPLKHVQLWNHETVYLRYPQHLQVPLMLCEDGTVVYHQVKIVFVGETGVLKRILIY